MGRSGWLRLARLTVESLEEEERLLFAAIDNEGRVLPPEVCARFFDVGGEVVGRAELSPEALVPLQARLASLEEQALSEIGGGNEKYFEREIDKLDRWAEDRKNGLEVELKEIGTRITQLDRQFRLGVLSLEEKLDLQKQKKALESERKEKRRRLYDAEDEIEARKGDLIAEVEKRLQQQARTVELFTIRWEVA